MGRYRRAVGVFTGVVLTITLGAVSPAAAQAPAGVRIDLTVLVVTDGGPNTTAIAAELDAQGVPYRAVDLRDTGRPVIDAGFLADTVISGGVEVDRARYQAVVLPGPNPFGNAAEWAALTAYQQRFDIPQVNAFAWPDPSTGLDVPMYSGPFDGATAALTPAAAASFGYLRGPVPFEDNAPDVGETWAFLTRPLPADPVTGAVAVPLLTAAAPDGTPGGTLMAEYRANGRRQLTLTFSANGAQQQFRLLAPGIVTWMTDGVHLGLHRNYLSVQVDDVFLPDSRWSVSANCTPGEDCPPGVSTNDIRMSGQDATVAAVWQARQQFQLDLVFNAAGSAEAAEQSPTGRDALTSTLVLLRNQFRWTNHTWSHDYLGCVRDASVLPWRCATDPVTGDVRWVGRATIDAEIAENLDWAAARRLPLDRSELVTGEHSGLKILPQQPQHNPNLAPALTGNGITWLAADNSRMPQQTAIGSALTVPRYPMNVYFNVAKRAEQVDEYNWIYTSRADGGSGICEDNPLTVTCIEPLNPATGYTDYIVPLETRFALTRMLSNDPRPHFVHQANIAEERILYPLLDSILGRYRSLLAANAPIVNPRLSAAGTVLKRQADWAAAVRDGTAGGHLQDGVVHVTAPAGLDVPLTVPPGSTRDGAAFGEAYAGLRSAFGRPAADGTITVDVP